MNWFLFIWFTPFLINTNFSRNTEGGRLRNFLLIFLESTINLDVRIRWIWLTMHHRLSDYVVPLRSFSWGLTFTVLLCSAIREWEFLFCVSLCGKCTCCLVSVRIILLRTVVTHPNKPEQQKERKKCKFFPFFLPTLKTLK